jgi:hypothetical protein
LGRKKGRNELTNQEMFETWIGEEVGEKDMGKRGKQNKRKA